jgi:hypothetical protein
MANKTWNGDLRRYHTDNTRELIRTAAYLRGMARSTEVSEKIEMVIKNVRDTVEKNGGTYPTSEPLLSINDISRRAGLHVTTVFGKKHTKTLEEIKKFLADLRTENSKGVPSKRKSLQQRNSEWEAKYAALQQCFRDTELELQTRDDEFKQAISKNEELKDENEDLRRNLQKFHKLTTVDR